jgi:hypothetical protein
MSMGSVSSLSATFSRQTVTQTRITSHSPLPAMEDLKDLYQKLGTEQGGEPDYATVLEARWQQILKALDEMKAQEMDGLFARRMDPKPLPLARRPADPPAPPPVSHDAEPAARQMLAQMEQLLVNHPKLSPFAGPLAATAMTQAAGRSEHPDAARNFSALQNAFRNRLDQWFLPAELPGPNGTTDTAV